MKITIIYFFRSNEDYYNLLIKIIDTLYTGYRKAIIYKNLNHFMKQDNEYQIVLSNKEIKGPKNKLLEEIEEEIKKKENNHDSDIKKLKSEIKLLKHQMEDITSLYLTKQHDLQQKYHQQLALEKKKSFDEIKKFEEKLKNLKENQREIQKELYNVDITVSRIKLSCEDEIESFVKKKKVLDKMNKEIEEQINNIRINKLKDLKKLQKDTKSQQKQEIISYIEQCKRIKQEIISEFQRKNDLVETLEFSKNELVNELKEISNMNKTKIGKIDSLIIKTEHEANEYAFSMSKHQKSTIKLYDRSFEETLTMKNKELEQLKYSNSYLQDRAEKLKKFIYGRMNIDE